jgi:mannose-1-phosphate guanylyltransferase
LAPIRYFNLPLKGFQFLLQPVVSGRSQAEVLELQTSMIPKANLIYQPDGKNRLPCIGMASMFAEKENPDGIMVVTPSDHLIENDELFRDKVLAAAKHHEKTG